MSYARTSAVDSRCVCALAPIDTILRESEFRFHVFCHFTGFLFLWPKSLALGLLETLTGLNRLISQTGCILDFLSPNGRVPVMNCDIAEAFMSFVKT